MMPLNYGYIIPRKHAKQQLPEKYAEDIECIINSKDPDVGSLYISNVEAAQNPMTLKKYKIGAVLSCAKGYELNHPPHIVPHYKYIPTVDHEECDISIHFDEAVDFIASKLQKTNVLAHCIAGVSRSVSMVLAYLIREHGMQYDQAYHLVKSKRKIIHPNDGFIVQLKRYSERVKANTPKWQLVSVKKKIELKYALGRSNLLDTSNIQRTKNILVIDKIGSPNLTPKRGTYDDSLRNSFKSIQFVRHGDINTSLEKYKSSHYIPNSQYQNSLQKTTATLYTPRKVPVRNYQQNTINYDQISRSVKIDRDYDSMNSELINQMEQISIKYAIQRQKLRDKFQKLQPKQNFKERRYQTGNGFMEDRRGSIEHKKVSQPYQNRVHIDDYSTAFEQDYSSNHMFDRNDEKMTSNLPTASSFSELYSQKNQPQINASRREESSHNRRYEDKQPYDPKYDRYLETRTRQSHSPVYNYEGNYKRY